MSQYKEFITMLVALNYLIANTNATIQCGETRFKDKSIVVFEENPFEFISSFYLEECEDSTRPFVGFQKNSVYLDENDATAKEQIQFKIKQFLQESMIELSTKQVQIIYLIGTSSFKSRVSQSIQRMEQIIRQLVPFHINHSNIQITFDNTISSNRLQMHWLASNFLESASEYSLNGDRLQIITASLTNTETLIGLSTNFDPDDRCRSQETFMVSKFFFGFDYIKEKFIDQLEDCKEVEGPPEFVDLEKCRLAMKYHIKNSIQAINGNWDPTLKKSYRFESNIEAKVQGVNRRIANLFLHEISKLFIQRDILIEDPAMKYFALGYLMNSMSPCPID